MGKYAEYTTVSPEKSKMEIEQILARYGATSFASGWQGAQAVIVFEANKRRVKFTLPLPEYGKTKLGRYNYTASKEQCEQETRRRWRCLVLAIKAKLEVVESGIATFEEEFLAHIVMPNGQSAGDWMKPQIETAYESKKMPPLLYGGPQT